jgi:4-hydroxy-2-oxoheptanedioate aldolase
MYNKEAFLTQKRIGIFSKSSDSMIVESCGLSGMDFIILDKEHGTSSFETLVNLVRAAESTGMYPIIRVPCVDSNSIGSALDIGAFGVQIPNISSAEEAKKAVESARFYPTGKRGVCRFVRAADYGAKDKTEYFQGENQKLVVLQVEGIEGINNLDHILDVPGFDILFVGPYDLSQSIGKPGMVESSEVMDLIDEIASKAHTRNIKLGTFCDSLHSLEKFKQKGFDYIAYSVDINIFMDASKNIVREFKK